MKLHTYSPLMMIMAFPKVKEGLHLHLIAYLILALGTTPGKSQVPQCYSCDSRDCYWEETENLTRSIANCSEGACFKSGWLSNIQRGCYSKAKADCFLKNTMLEGNNCYYPGDNKTLDEELTKCFEESKGEGNDTFELPSGTGWKSCVCTGHLCNFGPVYKGKGLECKVGGGYSSRRCEEGALCLSEDYFTTANVYPTQNRACMDARGVDCFKKKYAKDFVNGKKCLSLKTDQEKFEYDRYIRSCSNNTARRLTPSWQTHKYRLEVCLCDSNECNPAEYLTSTGGLVTGAIISVLSITKVYSM